MKYIDIHTHPFKEYYSDPVQEVNNNIINGVDKMLFVGTSWKELPEVLKLSQQFPANLFPVIGIHPSLAKLEDYSNLEKYITPEVVGIGEIGLDYYWEKNPNKEVQINCFVAQLEIALKHKLPAMLHVRDAFEDVYEIISQEKYRKIKIIFHTFSGDAVWAKKFLDLGCYLSFSGVLTFKNAKNVQEAAKITPVERIFIETDAPYLTPVPYRGKRNHSYYVKHTAKFLAILKEIHLEDLLAQLSKNLKDVFGV